MQMVGAKMTDKMKVSFEGRVFNLTEDCNEEIGLSSK